MNVDLRSLIAKLNTATRNAVEAAAGLCLARTHYDVEIEHLLMKLLDATDTDVTFILRQYEVDRSRVAGHLTAGLDVLKTGNARTPALAPSLVRALTDAWTIASVDYGARQIRTGHIMIALLASDELSRMVRDMSADLANISVEELRRDYAMIVAASSEESGTARANAEPGTSAAERKDGPTPNLDQYTIDLTGHANAGLLDPVLGRDFEVRQVVDILTRRRQNNPILVGEAGVGKTAVVEGFAMRVIEGDVPPVLRNIAIRTLDLALLQAGAGVKGEFENRLKSLIEEVRSSTTPVILFIDEAHTMIGAGGPAGQNDAANLLKPALARGELRTIAATTWSEYKKYFEKDAALARRFQLVKVEEPNEEQCVLMMRGVVPALERHHDVRIVDDGVSAAVRLSHRYLPDRQLPDKAVSVLDTACARLSLGQNATPGAVEDARRVLADLDVQQRMLVREVAVGADHSERLEQITALRAATETRLDTLTERWDRERELVRRIRDMRDQLERIALGDGPSQSPTGAVPADADALAADASAPADEQEDRGPTATWAPSPEALRGELDSLNRELDAAQGEQPLIPVVVDGGLIGQVVSDWTGIPVGKMLRDDVAVALELEQHLGRRVIGQAHALEIISHRIRTSKVGIEDPNKPVGVFLLIGPSGVGKTETALAVSDMLYGGEHNVIAINMSEFQEAHTVSTLKGSPPGYVGYGEGGVLTEAVRRRPYSVVLLDEIEKAHPDVLELFFQVFDKGRMEDGEGREIDFKNCVIILTTNAGTETIMSLTADPETMPRTDGLVKALKPELDRAFRPAFLGRTVIVPYLPVRDETLRQIIGLKLANLQGRLEETHRVRLLADDDVIDTIAERCTEVESGARNVDNILTNTLLPAVSRLLLESLIAGDKPSVIRVGIDGRGDFAYTVDGAAARLLDNRANEARPTW